MTAIRLAKLMHATWRQKAKTDGVCTPPFAKLPKDSQRRLIAVATEVLKVLSPQL